MSLKYTEILNFDSIIRDEWIEIANKLLGSQGCIGITSPMVSPYLERGAIKNIVSLLDAMRTIRNYLPEDKRNDFENRCLGETHVQYENQCCLLRELWDTEDSAQKERNIANKICCIGALILIGTYQLLADTATVNGITWTYTVSNGKASLGGSSYSSSSQAVSTSTKGALTIPFELGGYPVTSIGIYAFSGCSGLTNVTIPDSVTSIEYNAFSGCSGLTSVTIPNSVTNIWGSAFSGCSGLTSVAIGNGVTSIWSYAFRDCSGLTSVTIPDSVTDIGYGAFEYCRGLTSVTIGNGVTSIESSAFCDCSGLTSVTIPDSVTSIGVRAFDGCGNSLFDTITIKGIKLVDGWAVGTTESLSGYLNLTGVRGIADEAFSGCSGITSVTIPDSVTSIGDGAFDGCSGLTSVTIPDSVTSIGDGAFRDCSGLTSVTIPDSVTSIGERAFMECSGLMSVTIPDSVTSYGIDCFEECPAFYRAIFGGGSGGGSSTVVTTVVHNVEAPYALTNAAADRAIASMAVNSDCTIDSFVLKDGKVYDSMLYVSNTADCDVTLSLPSGYTYKTIKGAKPLTIPASSQCIISITRVDAGVFLVMREELEDVK